MEEFVTIEENVDYTLTEKKSKFIANLIRVNSKEEAENEIKKLKKNYYDARHNCFAYRVIENNHIVEKTSDDGEPSGTAGAPMLNILQKNGKLSDDEYSEIKNHPTIGAHILSTASIFKDILPIVKYHHERYDGRGYPEMLKGEEIPYLARITAIADTFDAMTSKRVYRDSLPLDRVIEEFKRCRGTQFDPELDDLFVDILENDYEEIEEIKNKYQAEI